MPTTKISNAEKQLIANALIKQLKTDGHTAENIAKIMSTAYTMARKATNGKE